MKFQRPAKSALFALVAGAILPFAFAPYGLYPIAVIVLASFFFVLLDATPAQAMWRGWLFGLGMFGHGVSWVQVSIHQFGLPLHVFSIGTTLVFVMLFALYPALNAYLVVRFFRVRSSVILLCVLPATWVWFEWLRGWLFTGFPWLLLGYSQTDSPLAGMAPILGAYGVSLSVALLAGALTMAMLTRGRARYAYGVSIILFIGAHTYARSYEWTHALAAPLAVTLVQGAVPQAIKWRPEQRQRTLELYSGLTEDHWQGDIIIWPETAIPAFPHELPDFLSSLQSQARDTGVSLLVGMPTGFPDQAHYYNSVVKFGTDPGRYDKHHLVPFGEYLPFDTTLRPILNFLKIPMSNFSAGLEVQALMTVAGFPVGVTICYEDAYSKEVNRALPAASFLVNVSNDAWFGRSIAPHQHLQIARMRAIETERYMLRATNTGISAVIDHNGVLVGTSPQFEPFALSAKVTPRSGATPFVRYSNWPLLSLLSLMLIGGIIWGRDTSRSV